MAARIPPRPEGRGILREDMVTPGETLLAPVAVVRDQLGRRIDQAHYQGEHTIVRKNGEPRAVLVPYKWWEEQQNKEEGAG